jgi:hypothetical protein
MVIKTHWTLLSNNQVLFGDYEGSFLFEGPQRLGYRRPVDEVLAEQKALGHTVVSTGLSAYVTPVPEWIGKIVVTHRGEEEVTDAGVVGQHYPSGLPAYGITTESGSCFNEGQYQFKEFADLFKKLEEEWNAPAGVDQDC